MDYSNIPESLDPMRFALLGGGNMLKKINHIAIAVNNIEEAAKFYQTVLGLNLSGVEVVTAQKTRVGFFKIGESNIELVEPAVPDSPIAKFLETKGQGIHHICFEVDDVEAEVKAYLEKGATLIDQKPRPGAHNTKVAFVHPKSSNGVLIELCEFSKHQ
jgi:methylmalonyl-CoA/ethylmalonyl-CoA epimerase